MCIEMCLTDANMILVSMSMSMPIQEIHGVSFNDNNNNNNVYLIKRPY